MSRDTYQTIRYKNIYIHLCFDRDLNKQIVEFSLNNKQYKCNSLAYAKRVIKKGLEE
jgi:hypothetical protein